MHALGFGELLEPFHAERRAAARVLFIEQAVSANMGGLTVPEALNEALRYTRGRRDTLNTLLLFRALLPWEARNEQTLQQAVRYAISDATWHPHVAPLALFAASQTDAAFANEALEQLQTR